MVQEAGGSNPLSHPISPEPAITPSPTPQLNGRLGGPLRIAAPRVLGDGQMALVSVAIAGFVTASIADESAQATAGLLKMEIMTNCQDGNAFFRVKNAGNDWPKTSTFAIYNMRKKGNKRVRKLIAKRRMRLKDG